jgi:hypothetical protein
MRIALVIVFLTAGVFAAPVALAEDVGPQVVAWQETKTPDRMTRTSTAQDDVAAHLSQTAPTRFYEVDPAMHAATANYQCSTCTQTPQKKKWRGMAAAYIWASSIRGDSYADGQKTNIDTDFSDLFDLLKYAFMGYFEIRHKKWSLSLDVSTLKLEKTGPAGLTTIDLGQTVVDLNVGYALMDCVKGYSKWGTCCYPRHMTLDALVGVRYWSMDTDLTVGGVVAGPTTVSSTTDWIDPYVGARWRYQWAKRWGVSAYADIGGFGIGDGSDLTTKLQATVNYRISRSFFVALGYRLIYADRIDGTGATRNGVEAAYHGPILGAGFTF